MIKAIIFDYGGVLSCEPTFHSFIKICTSKFKANPAELQNVILDNWSKAKVNRMDSGLFWQNVADFLKTDKEKFRKDLMNHFGFRKEVLELIKKLKPSYKLGILSNQIEDWLEEVIQQHKFNEIFDVIVTSYNSGVAKPDPAIYKEIIGKLGVKPEECVFIDDMQRNTDAAEKLGMKGIIFKDVEHLKKELQSFSVKLD